MIKLSTFILLILFTISCFAQSEQISKCTQIQLSNLEETIFANIGEGYNNVSYLKNSNDETLGFYSWNTDLGIYVELCNQIQRVGYTVASEWYYWDGDWDNLNPNSWEANGYYRISQDEGIAYFKVINPALEGGLRAELTIVGWDENSNDEVIKKEIVLFKNR